MTTEGVLSDILNFYWSFFYSCNKNTNKFKQYENLKQYQFIDTTPTIPTHRNNNNTDL